MGIWSRLGSVIKNYLDDADTANEGTSGDPDLAAAFEELEDYLGRDGGGQANPPRDIPEWLRPDFAELEIAFGASGDVCKAAYKRLLKIHHPDRHASHPGNFKKATDKTARLNAAYDRIEQWRRGNGG